MTRPLGDKPARKISVQIPVDDDLFEILERTWKDHPDLFASRADAARALMYAGLTVLTGAAALNAMANGSETVATTPLNEALATSRT